MNPVDLDIWSEMIVQLNDMVASFQEQMADAMWMRIANMIALIGVLIHGLIIANKLFKGEGSLEGFGKWFVIYLGILFYAPLLQGMNKTLDMVNLAFETATSTEEEKADIYFEYKKQMMAEKARSKDGTVSEKTRELYEKAQLALKEEGVVIDESDDGGGIIQGVEEWWSGVMQWDGGLGFLADSFGNLVYELFVWTGKIAGVVLNIVRTFFLIILSMLGIFSLAFSIVPSMENSFFTWLQKYIHVYLWLGVSYVLQFVLNKTYNFITYSIDAAGGKDIGETMVDATFLSLLGVCGVIGHLMVPSIANMLVQSSASSLSSQLQANRKYAQRKAGTLSSKVKSMVLKSKGGNVGNLKQ